MIQVSVIIPVYNVEPYFRSCVESVLKQTYRNIEVILVDDGTPDTCACFCDEYMARDMRVKVVHQRNKGLSEARNKGVKVAWGDYCMFLDSDDYWDNHNALFYIVERAQKRCADILSYPYYKLDEVSGKKEYRLIDVPNMPLSIVEKQSQLDFLNEYNAFIASAWNKLLKIDLIRAIPFETNKLSEDVAWCAKVLNAAHSFDFVQHCFYCYRQREQSISHTIQEKNCNDLKDAIIVCCELYRNSFEETKKALGFYTAYQYATFIATQAFTSVFQKRCINALNPYWNILRYYGSSRKVKIMYFGTRVMGLINWCRLIRITKSIWDSRRSNI